MGLIWPKLVVADAGSVVAITQTAGVTSVVPDDEDGTVRIFSGVSIGSASSDRIVCLLVGSEDPEACIANSVTIDHGGGDVGMTAQTSAAFGLMAARIFRLAVPTGTTATFKVTYDIAPTFSANTGSIAVYAVTGGVFSSEGVDTSTDMDASDPLTTGSRTIPANGGFLALAVGGTDVNAKDWANATEDLDADAGVFRFTTAKRTTEGTVTITCTGTSNGEDGALAWVIFNPA